MGRARLIKGKITLNFFFKNPPTAAPAHPFASQPRSGPAVVFPMACGRHSPSQQPREGISGQGRATQEQPHLENFVLPGKQLSVMEASFWGYFLLLIGFVSPQPQVTESAPDHKPQDKKQNAAEPTQSQQGGEGAQQCQGKVLSLAFGDLPNTE